MYRLAAIDLDGTLLNSANAISEGNAEALRWLAARGVHVAAATARSYESAMRQFEGHGIEPADGQLEVLCAVQARFDLRDNRCTVIIDRV